MRLGNLVAQSTVQALPRLAKISTRILIDLLLPLLVGKAAEGRRDKYGWRCYARKLGLIKGLLIYVRVINTKKGLIKTSIPQCRTPILLRAGTSDILTFEEVFLNEEYRLPIAAVPNLIFDGGANIGLVTLYFATNYPNARIFAIEPESSNVELLKANTNGYPNVTVVQAGIWHQRGHLKIENPEDEKWAFRVQPTESATGCIPAVRIDDILDMAGAASVDVLKLDIEGAEKEVFLDSRSWIDKFGVMLVELHDRFKPGCGAALQAATSSHDFTRYDREDITILANNDFFRPKSSPKQLSIETISALVSREYGLSSVAAPTVMSGGMESAVWSIKSDQGDWVVKAFARHQGSFERVEGEVRLYEYLNANGLHAPVVRPTGEGARVASLTFGNEVYPIILMRLEQLRKCQPSFITKEELTEIARAQARMHQVLREYPQCGDRLNSANVKPTVMAYAKLMLSPNAASLSPDVVESFKALDRRMVDYAIRYQPKGALTETVLHADMSLEHAQFLPDGEVYFFDFADRLRGPVALGVATALLNLYTAEDISNERWEQLRAWLMEGYTSVCELSDEDRCAIEPLLITRSLHEIAYLSETATAMGVPVDACDIKRRYGLAEHVLRDLPEPPDARFVPRKLVKRVLAFVGLSRLVYLH